MQDLFLLSTDPQVIPEHRQRVGVVIMIVMGVNIAFAVGIMTFESIKETIRQCRMKKNRKSAVKEMKKRKEEKESKRLLVKAIAEQERQLNPIESSVSEEPL